VAVSKMKLVNIIGHIDSLDATLYACGKTGVTQPDETLTFFSNTTDFTTLNEENPYTEALTRLESAVSRIGGKLTEVDVDISTKIDREELKRYANHFSERVTELNKQRRSLSMHVEQLNKDCEQFEHFLGLGIDLDAILACTMIKVRFGRLPKDSYEKLELYDANPYVLFFPGTCDGEYYWGVYFAPLDFADEVGYFRDCTLKGFVFLQRLEHQRKSFPIFVPKRLRLRKNLLSWIRKSTGYGSRKNSHVCVSTQNCVY